jgi:NTE family protein
MTSGFLRKSGPDTVSGRARARALPKIGFALGAGAARGWAHIGALQELTEMGVVPEIVAGSSIGALVAGCYAAGHLAGLEDFARSLTKRRVFGLLDFSFSGAGLIGGDRLRQRLHDSLGDTRIEDLPIRFAAVATEMRSGHEIWLKRGPAVEAMRASYAMPGVFEPVKIGGRWLFDGAIVNPVPVSVARALGAECVIALNLMADGAGHGVSGFDFEAAADPAPVAHAAGDVASGIAHGARRLFSPWRGASDGARAPGLATVMVTAFNISQDRIMRSRMAGDPPDVVINLKVGAIGIFEFHRADELIALGREAVRRARDEIVEHLALTAPAEG